VGRATEKPLMKVIYIVEIVNVMCANGTAVVVVSVTGEAIRLMVPVASKE
jgi:hypothetical protein